MAAVRAADRTIETRELWRLQAAVRLARHRAVEQHDAPVAEIHVTAHLHRRAGDRDRQRRGDVVIARQAIHWQPGFRHHDAEMAVAARLVVHDVAGYQQCVVALAAIERMRQYRAQRCQRRNAAQRAQRVRKQVRVGDMQQADVRVHGSNVSACVRWLG
jgi:hypothetical protein